MARILAFSGLYHFLSNFFIEPDGTCVENEFQAAKCANPKDKAQFLGLAPGKAKRKGQQIQRRSDWEQVKVSVMKDFVRKKFMDHKMLENMLLSTGDAELLEGNNHGDDFWGVVDGAGKNHLGKILMEVREELRNDKS